MDRTTFLNMMAEAQLAYGNKLSEETAKIYWENLQDVDGDASFALLRKHIETERFFPRISDLRPPKDNRPQSGPQYLPPPKMSEGKRLVNKVILALIMQEGGVPPELLKQMKMINNAQSSEWDDELGRDEEYRKQFVEDARRELTDQINHYKENRG